MELERLEKRQQGDVVFWKLSNKPMNLRLAPNRILVSGQNNHFLIGEAGRLFLDDNETLYIWADSDVTVGHGSVGAPGGPGNHPNLSLTAGAYWEVGRVREKGLFTDMVNNVVD